MKISLKLLIQITIVLQLILFVLMIKGCFTQQGEIEEMRTSFDEKAESLQGKKSKI